MTPEQFTARWRAFARAWHRSGRDKAMIERALAEGVAVLPPAAPETEVGDQVRDTVGDEIVLACETALVRASGTFDAAGYRAAYVGVH